MSRIDEALRRAAETGQEPPVPHGQASQAMSGQDVALLANEPFPVEIGSRVRAVPPPAPGRSAAGPEPENGGKRQESRSTRSTRRESVFERIDSRLAEKIVADANLSPMSREQYRRLAATLHDAQSNAGLRVVMIASAVAGEGKTLTASNLALTLSESYQKNVLLIDADLRKPTLHQVFTINSALGLTDGLDPAARGAKLVVHQLSPRLAILPAGRPTSDPMAGLVSDLMRRLVEEAKETFDWVIIDTPPIVLLPDANLLAAMVDAAILVIKARSTPHALVKRAVDAIGAKRIIGTVLNQAAGATAGYGYGDYYGDYYLADEKAAERT